MPPSWCSAPDPNSLPVHIAVPYATPPQYLSDFGIDEALQLLRDEERLLTKQLLLDAIAGTWTGTPSAPEKLQSSRLVRRASTTD